MTQAPHAAAPPAPTDRRGVCPFCAALRSIDGNEPCTRCGLPDTNETRSATADRLGPWFVFQRRNPAAPGMNWVTLRQLVEQGRVKGGSVVRGPTTGQMWTLAGRTRGVSRLLGACWKCQGKVAAEQPRCPNCRAEQTPPTDANTLVMSTSNVANRPAVKVPNTWIADAEAALPEHIRHVPPTTSSAKSPHVPSTPLGERPRRKGRLRRFVIAFLALLIVAGGAYLAFDPNIVPRTWEKLRTTEWQALWNDLTDNGPPPTEPTQPTEPAAPEAPADDAG